MCYYISVTEQADVG